MESPLTNVIASPEWAAGIFEGEGSIHISVPRNSSSGRTTQGALMVQVSQADREMLDILQKRFGGSIHAIKRQARRKQAYCWALAAQKAAKFLREILPHIRTARIREKVELGIAFQAQKSRMSNVNRTEEYRQRQDDFRVRLSALNVRGAEA